MCTLSVVPIRDGFRIACNRDERLTRPAAEPPKLRHAGCRRAVWPLDPLSGGTWIGASDAGLAMFILNRTPRQRPVPLVRPRSRGTIIPPLLRSPGIGSAIDAATALPAWEFEPFTLVVLQGTNVRVLTNAGGRLWTRAEVLTEPLVFTSSSLGDHIVLRPRRALFARLVQAGSTPLRGQADFHRHFWPDRRDISVHMTRPDAATVSQTVLEVADNTVHIRYTPVLH